MGTTFPWPLYSVSTRRPFYDEEMQTSCLEARRRNCGIDGKPIMFYSKRIGTTIPAARAKKVGSISTPAKKETAHDDILAGLRSLGLAMVTVPQVTVAVKELFPEGVNDSNRGKVLRAVFLHLKRQNRAANVGR
jgi:hypothetical protein